MVIQLLLHLPDIGFIDIPGADKLDSLDAINLRRLFQHRVLVQFFFIAG